MKRSNVVAIDQSTTYLCFHLYEDTLSAECRQRLENLGVECLCDAEPYHAYGVAPDLNSLIRILEQDPEIVFIERQEPPCGK